MGFGRWCFGRYEPFTQVVPGLCRFLTAIFVNFAQPSNTLKSRSALMSWAEETTNHTTSICIPYASRKPWIWEYFFYKFFGTEHLHFTLFPVKKSHLERPGNLVKLKAIIYLHWPVGFIRPNSGKSLGSVYPFNPFRLSNQKLLGAHHYILVSWV